MKQLSLVKEPGKMSLNNAGTVTLSRMVNINDIKTQKEFEQLFPIVPVNLEKITRRMIDIGYDESQPVQLWEIEGKLILIDGHHRILAAREAGLSEIPGYFHHFKTMEEALEYAISIQVERRNLSDAELLIMIKVVDQLKVRGKGSNGEKGKSAQRTAEILGTNTSKVEKARIVEKYGSEELKEKIAAGKLSLNQAYLEARMAREQNSENQEEHCGEKSDEPEDSGKEENPERILHDVDSQTLKFLRAAAIVLTEKKEAEAVRILVNHFLRKKERPSFYSILPKWMPENGERESDMTSEIKEETV
jgi:ParB family chromosome partitioning protein